MKRTTRILLMDIMLFLGLLALACTCFSSGVASQTDSPTSQPAKGVPSNTAAVPPGSTPEASLESNAGPTLEQPRAWPALSDMGRIVFSSIRENGLFDIYLMNADGSDVRYLAGEPDETDLNARWSPDAEWIAFIGSSSEGTFDIFRVRPDGSDLEKLTDTPADESAFDWSPDGSQIVFDSSRGGNYDLYVMNADGSNVRQLTRTKDRDEVDPAWSPTGDSIACLCGPTGATAGDVCIMNADGSSQTNLTPDDPDVDDFIWSPYGSKIAFGMPVWPEEIWIMGADGSDKQNLSNNPADDGGIAFSPDGTMIAFRSNRDGKTNQIYILRLKDSYVYPLTDNKLMNVQPSWSPDGTWIVFLSAKSLGEFDYEIYAVRIDGNELTNLTSSPTTKDQDPDWEPL
jgi:Tol biopolymer transport system component